jgi:hypothetical protein
VVLGTRRRGWLRRALGGGVSRTITRKAERPVGTLTVPADWPPGLRPRAVLYATDHPEPDVHGFALAHDLARARGGEFTVLYVPPRLWARQGRRTEDQWRRLIGLTTDLVLGTASALRAGLVVMPAWGRSGLRDLFDPAAAVRNRAPCPVLTVHPPAGGARAGPASSDGIQRDTHRN